MVEAVGLQQLDEGVVFVFVPVDGFVDVVDQQALSGQLPVIQRALPVLEQEVFLAACAVLPEAIHLAAALHVLDR